MSSDADYASFLDQANQDTGAKEPTAKSQGKFAATKAVDTEIPKPLLSVEQYYTSDTDEPFEPVSLKWSGRSLPSEDEFQSIIDHEDDVSILSKKEFDPRGQYSEVFKAVEQAGAGDITVYRVAHSKTRAEYYVVGLDSRNSRIVGLKAKAVES